MHHAVAVARQAAEALDHRLVDKNRQISGPKIGT